MDEKCFNNVTELTGVLGGCPRFSHVSREERYYTFPLEVQRLSGAVDTLNIMARQDLLEQVELSAKPKITVRGELRSFNNKTGSGSRLIITIFARTIYLSDEADRNHVALRGVICKAPNLRRTPMGREICDLMLAISRRYGRSDYLPAISWGQNAIEANGWTVGMAVALRGRIQSRTYIKLEGGNLVERTAFEVSVIGQERVL
ncbi:MAG: single-stranded DNA-binding protein [Oscillospiraceae bacterium]|nr:single-stranded DNA-binding protein [Oscillospiraceae bacterium]